MSDKDLQWHTIQVSSERKVLYQTWEQPGTAIIFLTKLY